jgi:hypothetical protein
MLVYWRAAWQASNLEKHRTPLLQAVGPLGMRVGKESLMGYSLILSVASVHRL